MDRPSKAPWKSPALARITRETPPLFTTAKLPLLPPTTTPYNLRSGEPRPPSLSFSSHRCANGDSLRDLRACARIELCATNDFNTSSRYTRTEQRAKFVKSRKVRPVGAKTYTQPDIDALLDCVEYVQPLGGNHWLQVAEYFNDWAVENYRLRRDDSPLRGNFDKLFGTKKPTGDPRCPNHVRRAKNCHAICYHVPILQHLATNL